MRVWLFNRTVVGQFLSAVDLPTRLSTVGLIEHVMTPGDG